MRTLSGGGPQQTLRIPDYLEYHNAHQLAEKIRSYWRERGYKPMVIVEPMHLGTDPTKRPSYVVRSDMVGGWPHG